MKKIHPEPERSGIHNLHQRIEQGPTHDFDWFAESATINHIALTLLCGGKQWWWDACTRG